MNTATRLTLLTMLAITPLWCNAEQAPTNCFRDAVEAHVREQYQVYGPQSNRREYFGFIYVREGVIGSAITRSNQCKGDHCTLSTVAAGKLIPTGAKVLGEWHTHPRDGSASLSMDDIHGAYNNRHIRCYIAYYAKPDGEIHSWDPGQTSVPSAMASRVLIGNYSAQLAVTANTEVKYTALPL